MIEYTKLQQKIIVRNLFNSREDEFYERAMSKGISRKDVTMDPKFGVYLEINGSGRIFFNDLIKEGVSDESLFVQLRGYKFHGVNHDYVREHDLLKGWSAENDEEWQERETLKAQEHRQERDIGEIMSEEEAAE